MKTLLLTLLGLFFAFGAFSQITIEEVDLMQPGDTFLIHVDILPTIDINLETGADLTWDFTGLTNDESNYACFAPNNDLDFNDEFSYSDFHTYGPGYIYAGPGGGAPLDNWGYMMFFTNPDGLYAEGFYSDYGMGYRSTFNTPAELLMPVPFSYENSEDWSSYWEVVVDENVMDHDTLYRRDISKNFNADAWGSIVTDYGTYNVLRTHETGISKDSIFGYVGTTTYFAQEVATDTINKYYFWSKDIRHPVLTVYCDFSNNVLRVDFLMGVLYSDNNQINTSSNINVYPNPANNNISLKGINGDVQILDYTGRIIFTADTNNNCKIDISNLKQGLYFIKDSEGNTFRFVKN